MKYLIAIDAGTTSFKGAIFDECGMMLSTHSCAYELITDEQSVVEFTAEGYRKIFAEVIAALVGKSGVDAESIVGLSIDSQGETMICVDKAGAPLRNAIVWLDGRAVREAREIKEEFGSESVYERTGQNEIAPGWPACKILWIRRNEPEIFARTHRFLLLEDYLIYCLTGKYATEKSLLTSTLYFDINIGTWWKEMLEFIGIDECRLPDIYHSGVSIGRMTEMSARELGLSTSTTVVTGAFDQLAGLIGSGITVDTGKACETTGTCLTVCTPMIRRPEIKRVGNPTCHAGAMNGDYYQIYWSPTAGAVLEWFKNNFYAHLKNRVDIYKIIDREAAEVPVGSQGLIFLPHFSGMACPELNLDAKGVIYGIGLQHERKHFARAIMESVGYMLYDHLKAAVESGTPIDEIRSVGGGSRSHFWNQMKADITGIKVVTMENRESACLGTAILAGIGIGLFSDIGSAVRNLVKTECEFVPDPERHRQYQKRYEIYQDLYQSLKHIYSKSMT